MRVYIGCFGSGLGHARRMLEVARVLEGTGSSVVLSSSGEVASLIAKSGYRCNELPLADVRYSESGEFSLRETLLSSPSILARTYHQTALEISNILRFGPDVVLSDSALSTVLAAKAAGVPAYTVLNQLNLTSSQHRSGAPSRLLSFGTSAAMGRLWELSDQIFLPDLPPPFTISERNLWGTSVRKARYVGFLTSSGKAEPDDAARDFAGQRRPRIFWQVSGPPKTRPAFLEEALECAARLSDRYSFVVSAGSPTASSVATRIPGGWSYGWCEIADFYFKTCDAVVSRAGHGTIGQALVSSKPSLLVPITRQPEQEGNAAKAARLGISMVLSQDQVAPEIVGASISSLLHDGFAARARRLGAWARSFDPTRDIVSALRRSVR